MQCHTRRLCSRYIPVVGRAFLAETLYGSKYSAHVGVYPMPFLYAKTLLLCATGTGLQRAESQFIHGLVEALVPSNVSDDNLTKVELMQFIDAVPSGPDAQGPEGGEGDSVPAELAAARDQGSSNNSSSGGGAAAELAAVGFICADNFPAAIARILVYDAVATCLADGLYSAEERERVAMVSARVGLSAAVREQIERLCVQETIVAARKRAMLNLVMPASAREDAAPSAAPSAPGGSSSRAASQPYSLPQGRSGGSDDANAYVRGGAAAPHADVANQPAAHTPQEPHSPRRRSLDPSTLTPAEEELRRARALVRQARASRRQ